MHLITIPIVLLFLSAMAFSAPLVKAQTLDQVLNAILCQDELDACKVEPGSNASTWYVAVKSSVLS